MALADGDKAAQDLVVSGLLSAKGHEQNISMNEYKKLASKLFPEY